MLHFFAHNSEQDKVRLFYIQNISKNKAIYLTYEIAYYCPSKVTFCVILFPKPSGILHQSLSHVRLFVTPWSIQSTDFSRPEYWSGKPFPSPEDLPNPGIKPRSPTLQADSLPAKP